MVDDAAAPIVSEPPEELLCPITQVALRDPVVCASGNTYERSALFEYWQHSGTARDPLQNIELPTRTVFPNWDKRRAVQRWLTEHPDVTPAGWESRSVPLPEEQARRQERW